MWTVTVLVGLVVALAAKYVMDRRRRQRVFQEQGIPGPKPGFLFGNLHELYRGSLNVLMDWHKEYGKTFAFFEGERPVLVTSDLEILKYVLIKDFSNFHSRNFSLFFTPDESLVHQKELENWKRLRTIVSPTFSAARMKEMSPLVNQCVKGLLEILDEKAQTEKPFDIMKDFQGLTMTAIASCAFGLEVDALNDPDNIFLQKCRTAFEQKTYQRPFYFKLFVPIVLLFPKLAPLIRLLNWDTSMDLQVWFYATAAAIIESRQNQKSERKDFIQLMLDARESQGQLENLSALEVSLKEDSTVSECTTSEESTKEKKTEVISGKKGKGMTLSEMQAQCMAFLLAGYETTSTALSFTAYELALHPDIQQKLQQEIDEHLPEEQLPDYLSVQKMPYMDMVFSEVLRLHSIAQVVTIRECESDWNIDGLFIPQGTVVRIHMEAIHKDPESWGPEDPEDFVPERFLPERKAARSSLAWQPFGGGPRNCVGMRFALMEAKITLARVLKAFTIVRAEETQVPLRVAGAGIAKPTQGVVIKLERRSQ